MKQPSDSSVMKELKDLERKYRILDLDNRRFNDETEGVLRKQRSSIESLTQENRRLMHEVGLYQAVPHDVDHRLIVDRQNSALEEIRILMNQINKAELSANGIEHSLSVLRKRLKSGQEAGPDSIGADCEGRIHTFEKRLHNTIVKFNETITNNTSLRTEVDGIRQEKAQFVKLEEKLRQDIDGLKRQASDLIDRINANYAAKDKAFSDLEHLRSLADREHLEFEKQWKELVRLIETDIQIHRPVDLFKQAHADDVPPDKPTQTTVEQDEERQLDIEAAKRKLIQYESIFERIKEATGFLSMDELMDSYLSLERANYSLYTHMDLLISETEKSRLLRDHNKLALGELQPPESITDGGTAPKSLEQKRESLKHLEEKIFFKKNRLEKISKYIFEIYSRLRDDEPSARSSFTDLMVDLNDEESVVLYLSKIDALLDTYIDSSTRMTTNPRHRKKRMSVVNVLSLPSSVRIDDVENKVTSDTILTREELVRLAATKPAVRPNSSTSTRPSTTNHSRKSILVRLDNNPN